ncbi:MAG TPA: hypothetical protein VIK78_16490 [Ruminiclostridium sp.]
MKNLCNITIMLHSDMTFKIQDYHLSIYHALCAMIEAEFYTE